MTTLTSSTGSAPPSGTPGEERTLSMGTAGKAGIVLAVITALALVIFGVVVATRAGHPSTTANVAAPQLISMDETARAMQQAGLTMQTHGQEMLAQGQQTGDQDLVAHGNHWISDGKSLVQAGQWMGMDPTAVVAPNEVSAADRAQLNQAVRNMLHDPSKASSVDVETLRWNGQSMHDEGQNMLDHANVMAEDVQLMIERHRLQGQVAADLRQAAETLRQAGDALMRNGQAMIDYADRLRRSMGLR